MVGGFGVGVLVGGSEVGVLVGGFGVAEALGVGERSGVEVMVGALAVRLAMASCTALVCMAATSTVGCAGPTGAFEALLQATKARTIAARTTDAWLTRFIVSSPAKN